MNQNIEILDTRTFDDGPEINGIFFDGLPESAPEIDNETHNVIDRMLNMQKTLMDACGVYSLPADIAYAVTLAAQQSEIVESMAFFADLTKPWKAELKIDLAYQRKESIDKLFFLLQEWNQLEMDAKMVVEMYIEKYMTNFARILQKIGETNGDLQ